MLTVVTLGPVTCLTNGTGSQLTTVNIEGIIVSGNKVVTDRQMDGQTDRWIPNAKSLIHQWKSEKLFSLCSWTWMTICTRKCILGVKLGVFYFLLV